MTRRLKRSKFRLNSFQRKELARVSLDIAKAVFLAVSGAYFIPPAVGLKEAASLSFLLEGLIGVLTFFSLGVILLKEVEK